MAGKKLIEFKVLRKNSYGHGGRMVWAKMNNNIMYRRYGFKRKGA